MRDRFLRLKRRLFLFLAFVTFPLFIYNICYPLFNISICTFPEGNTGRILLFADPQIRGHTQGERLDLRTEIDIIGNDYYLGNIYKTLDRWTTPSIVFVLGDLFSSQWIDDREFDNRVRRYKTRIFRSGLNNNVEQGQLSHQNAVDRHSIRNAKIINLAGNHDIGYAHEVTTDRALRFEKAMGPLNEVFEHDNIRYVVLNSMSIDGALDDIDYGQSTFTKQSHAFLENVFAIIRNESVQDDYSKLTILVTHIPLHKTRGICIDSPYFSFYDQLSEQKLIKEQNMIRENTSQWILEGLFPNGHGIVINGHDHEGCVVQHSRDIQSQTWSADCISKAPRSPFAYSYNSSESSSGVLEITLRSMMGEFGGNAGLLSHNKGVFNFTLCSFGVQHIWWASNILILIFLIALVALFLLRPCIIIFSRVKKFIYRFIRNQLGNS
ncbi:Metallo-dependent phosphatase-like protein [Dipodascopsis uninucleata]